MMVNDVPEPEPAVQAPPLGGDRLGAPDRAHDAAFAEFYMEFMPVLVRFLRWHGVPLADASEIAQDTMAQLYQHWPAVHTPSAWARRVASRRWGRQIADGHGEHLVDDVTLDQAATPRLLTADNIRAFEQHHDVLRLLDTLPPRQRQILAWTYDGYTPTQIAEELQLTPETVRANLYKARRAAAAYLREKRR
jgi:RNA polymerase sigma factor (sigma-70 family)